MSHPRPRIAVIVGSARPVRIGDQLGASIAAVIDDAVDADIRVLDLRDIALPMLDEPVMAALGQYAHDHTKRWAAEIADTDAVVFLTPQYNGGYPASLKNAIDYLGAEWRGRPGAIVSYGGQGGPLSAAQLTGVLQFIGIDLAETQPQLVIERTDYTPDWHLGDPDAVVARDTPALQAMAAELVAKVQDAANAQDAAGVQDAAKEAVVAPA
ncbi:NADPH-dependent FMN reductase [Microbacterium sp. bgisy203]|uniref:NADPH-dependent FMN reductase n=1 Tax=Microbacterium sp. bgisy203 TaxID=3413799 RepID=UPI003D75D96C